MNQPWTTRIDTLDVVTAILLVILLGVIVALVRISLRARGASSRPSLTPDDIWPIVEGTRVRVNERGRRLAMTIESDACVLPGVVTEVSVSSPFSRPINPDKIVIGEPASDWVVGDICIGGKSQFSQPAEIPGDCFSESATASGVSLDPLLPGGALTMSVTYVGSKPDGVAFGGLILGYDDPGPVQRKATKPMYRRPR